jgi:hypothetical protein
MRSEKSPFHTPISAQTASAGIARRTLVRRSPPTQRRQRPAGHGNFMT